MATTALWRTAMRLLAPSPKPAGIHLELMSNEDPRPLARGTPHDLTEQVSPKSGEHSRLRPAVAG